MKTNLVSQLLNGEFNKMSQHTRYSGAYVTKTENIAEHSFFVAIIADNLAEDIAHRFPDQKLDRFKILKFALYHDLEESFTGDIITPVKYKTTSLKSEWDKMAEKMLREGLAHDFPGHAHIFHNISETCHAYEIDKTTILENKIVKLADGLQSIGYILRQLTWGNAHVHEIAENLIQNISKKFQNDKFLEIYIEQMLATIAENNKNIAREIKIG